MTELTYPSPEQGKDKTKDDGCTSCDPGALDTLKCDAKGLQEQSTYLQKFADTSNTRRDKFDKVRQLNIDARAKATPDVKDIRAQLQHINLGSAVNRLPGPCSGLNTQVRNVGPGQNRGNA